MIILKKLYTEPEYFKPIQFNTGVNLIIGDKSDKSKKTNGVGKSICVEFINFCLLKGKKDSRVMKIPDNDFPLDTKIILDIKINDIELSIIRKRDKLDNVLIVKENQEIFFNTISKASDYLQNILFVNQTNKSVFPSFRQLFSPIIRDERSEFKDLINTFDTKKRIPPDFIPHLFLLGFDISIYIDFKRVFKQIEKQTTYIRKLKNDITENRSLKLTDVRAKVNALDDEVKKLNKAIEGLHSNEAFESVQKDLINLETELDSLRIRQKALKYEIKKIQSLPKPESISKTEIAILYNQFKQGLGDLIEKSLSDLEIFKAKIDNFRNNIINKKLEKLTTELNKTAIKIGEKDKKYSDILKTIDDGKILKNLKTGLSVFNKKSEELNKIRYQMTAYDEADKHKKNVLKPRLDELKLDINKQITENELIRNSFEQTILDIHEIIMNNKEASFYINTKKASNSKHYIDFEMRIFDDGSRSVERTKVFIYDMALMFNEHTKEKHPRLLIHDNIFDVDQDTLVQSLNYLSKQEELYPNDFQYILTLNRDKIENEEKQELINLDITSHRIANFTKKNRFLKIVYKEK
ncbi:MAG: hypothetical protein B6I24_09960 [Bacteroidetes bacterium 4572_128]|nr:MAG: hypothetical protein B6I24_09960 [Bacteroidetes bacterium 4572_128]